MSIRLSKATVVSLFLMVECHLSCSINFSSLQARQEANVLHALATIRYMQEACLANFDRFCDHQSLMERSKSKRPGSMFNQPGYLIEMATSGKAYTVLAKPTDQDESGWRSFFLDQTGIIRYELEGRTPARSSPCVYQPPSTCDGGPIPLPAPAPSKP